MLKRTPGKWDWKMTVLDNGDERVIFVDEQGNEIHPTLGDVKLMAASPEMYELLEQVVDELHEAAYIGEYNENAYKLWEKVTDLLVRIDVKSVASEEVRR